MTTQCHTPALGRKTGVDSHIKHAFRHDLVRWYQRFHRKLPWRATRDPYKIWVSEIMLQQTRVDVVRDYYDRWLRAFPTVESLAKAPYHRVLKLWEGLGYYTRAKNLHRAAKMIVRQRGSTIPQTDEQLQRLPGVGRYTAGAIASIAFGQRIPLVDGNVARVFARVFNMRGDVTKPATQKRLWSVAENILPGRDTGTFNQALMELGALVCVPVNPRCPVCPMAGVCMARAKGNQDKLPNRGPKQAHKLVVQDSVLVRRNGRILLQRRPAKGLLAGMWELPGWETQQARPRQPVLEIRHTITNRRITLRIFACRSRLKENSNGNQRWFTLRDLNQVTLPAAHRRALARIFPGCV